MGISLQRGRLAARTLLGAASLIAMASAAHAETARGDVSEVVVVARAVHVSPSAVPLEKTQPTSQIQKQFIENNIIPLASFDDLVKFSPSVADQSPNGPGLGKSETLSLRGFQDGQFNVTFDGIPFGDATDLHHTSSALFIAHDIGMVQIDRGPGTASTIGNATFGGSMNFQTKAPLDRLTGELYGTYGSFNTAAGGGEIDTGHTTEFGRAFLDGQYETSDGYLTQASEQRANVMFKDIFEVNDNLTITALASYNHSFEYTTQGTTLANIQKFGPNYGLGTNPKTQNFYGYNGSNYASDFNYVDVKAKLAPGWSLQNTAYTDSFLHDYQKAKDASDTTVLNDVTGSHTKAFFRAYGDILRVTGDIPIGQIQMGLWVERNDDARFQQNIDFTHGGTPIVKKGTSFSYNLNDSLTTVQPYVELDWNVTPNLQITPGVRFTDFIRDLDAVINKTKTLAPAHYSATYSAVQPSVAARYTIMNGWTAYAQVAEGFLAPPINLLEVTGNPANINPELTWNYQIGTAFHRGRFVLGADAYYVDFSNYITSTTVGSQTTYFNGGGAVYEGAELEGQYVLDYGFSLYGNASYNSAKYKGTSVWIAETPEFTSSFGVLYDDKRGPYASLIAKWIGSRYGVDVDANGNHANSFGLDPYVTADLAAGWRFKDVSTFRNVTLSVKVSNLFDNREINDYAGAQSAGGAPTYWTVAGRSVFGNISASF